ncbi:MAG TPA: phosphatidylserine/phosphatidylglycerophosphate/cardiolipin synthase family protein [Sphingorhabdus sp.]|jgi:cardiolipin synthase|nr:phosphatidylserine/phosphatidylglycerophosphate/cardiolipin synthase family protein [Sphingorhabdus sp.]
MEAKPPTPPLSTKQFDAAGHRLQVVHSADERLAAVIQLIATAKRSIRMFFYMFAADRSGQEVLASLVKAATRGISVCVIIDSFGSGDISDRFFDPLVEAGGHYHCFSSRKSSSYFIRNHQKMLIADEARVLIGGFNITDQYFDRKEENSWEDLGLIVTGPDVAKLAGYFDELDRCSRGGAIKYREVRGLIKGWQSGNGELRWLLGGPTNRLSPWALDFKRTLETAKRFDIVSAYFSPSQGIVRRIARVARKRKGSRLVMAGKTDNGATIGAARLLYRYLLKRHARIYEYQPRPLHTKLFVIDDAVYIGSANLDIRSLFINMEIMLRVENKAFADHMRGLIDGLVAQSEQQTRILLKRRDSWWARFKNGLAYFLVNSVDYSVGRRIKFGLLRDR